jgi:hypothetical protein
MPGSALLLLSDTKTVRGLQVGSPPHRQLWSNGQHVKSAPHRASPTVTRVRPRRVKRTLWVVLTLIVLALLGAWAAPYLRSQLVREPFNPEKIALELGRTVGQADARTGGLCTRRALQVGLLYRHVTCQPNRYEALEATEEISRVMQHYQARPTGGWEITEVGLIRTYRNPDQSSPDAARQALLVMVTNDVIIVGYN